MQKQTIHHMINVAKVAKKAIILSISEDAYRKTVGRSEKLVYDRPDP